MSLPNAMTITSLPNPQIISVSPDSAVEGQTISVSITAQNTNFGQGSTTTTTAWFEQGSTTFLPIININVISSTEISGQVSIPSVVALGNYNTWVSNNIDGQIVKPNSFVVYAGGGSPSTPIGLESLTPNWGEFGKLYTYTLVGHLTHFTDASLVLVLKNQGNNLLTVIGTNVNVINDSLVEFDAKIDLGGNTDTWDMYAYSNVDGALSITDAYVVSPVSIKSINKGSNVDIFPNPSNGIINIRSSEISYTDVEVSIHSSVGELLHLENINVSQALNTTVDISNLSVGIYFIQLKFNGKRVYQKILKN
jgi:hypothetical protein